MKKSTLHSFSNEPALTEPGFFILLSLAGQQKHGYAILKDVHALSGGKIQLSTSTLYNVIGRLLEQGLIARVESGDEPESGVGRPGLPRKAYLLTPAGQKALQSEHARLRQLVAAADLRLEGGQP